MRRYRGYKGHERVICKYCKKYFTTKIPKKYCSKECLSNHYKIIRCGDNNYNFKKDKNYLYKCETCGKEFKSYAKTARFCSVSCNAKRPDNLKRLALLATYAARQPKKRKSFGRNCICLKCGTRFINKTKKTYCITCKLSIKNNVKYPKKTNCVICKKAFMRKYISNKRATCSKQCLSLLKTRTQKGDKSHRWQGGKTSNAMRIRNSREYAEWRMSVFRRDNYTCCICQEIGGKLNADHIKSFAMYPSLRLEINNGRTLCLKCHKKTPTYLKKNANLPS